jgi:acyl dehydratase
MGRSLGKCRDEHGPRQNCDELQKAAMTKRYLEDFAAGQTFGSGRVRVDRERIKTFAAEFDPQPFHLDEEAARDTIFRGLAASGSHTAALTTRLLVESEFKPAGGIVGAGVDELRWPLPVRPGDELRVESEILEVRPSKSHPEQGLIKVRTTTLNQNGEAVQVIVANLIVPRRGAEYLRQQRGCGPATANRR